MFRRLGFLGIVLVILTAAALLLAVPMGPSSSAVSPGPGATPVRASAVTPSIWYNYSDFFNVPYGEWWDMRNAFGYGDEPIHADCFNITAYNDGTCANRVTGWPATPSYPYMDWAGSGSKASQGTATSVYAPYRANITAFNEPGYNLSQPVFLPVLNYNAPAGNSLSFYWYMQYLNKAQFTALTTAPLSCYSGSGANADDGYQIRSQIYLTMDNQEALRLFGATISSSTSTMQGWWNTNTLPGCGMTTGGKNPTAGPLEVALNNWFTNEGNGKYDIFNGFDLAYTPFYTNVTATVLSPGATGTTAVYIEHVAWGTETLMDRWFYWGNASYQSDYMNSGKAAGWWGMENGWWEDMNYRGTLSATGMNFNLKAVLQYHFQEHSSPGGDNCYRTWTNCTEASPVDDTPYWTWGPMLLDYGIFSAQHPSELSRMGSLNYIKTTPGSGDYGTNTSFDYTPLSWVAKANEWWNYQFPTNSSAYYQNPATAPIGTDPMKTGVPLPSVVSTLSFMDIFPASYGTWNAVAGTWSVTGGTTESWPAGTGAGTYPYLPYPGIYLQPSNIPPSVVTNPATSITSTTATLNGNLGSLGSAPSVPVGFIWGTDPALATGTTNTTIATETAPASFTDAITGLTLGTTYYFRAWASGFTFVKGAILSFNTGGTPPSVTTVAASGITTTTATLNGNLASLGTATSVEVGFCYGTTAGLTTGAANVTAATVTATGPFTYAATGLTLGTTYYFRAWASGAGFTNATSTLSFTTTTAEPQVTTDPASAVINTAANLNGHTTSLGTATSVPVGFWYGTSPTLATYQNQTAATQTAPGAFTYGLTGLTAATTYYFEAWANGNGFVTGGIVSFTTAGTAPVAPSVTTSAASAITTGGATLNGLTTALGTAASVPVGFYYGTDPNLVTATNVTAATQTTAGAFSSAVTGLTPGTTYYFRAWASGDGFVNGSILNFVTTTPAGLPPTVATNAASGVSASGATLNGATSSLGSATSITVGFLWGTSATLAGATNTTGTTQTTAGSFTQPLTSLTASTKYYFQAWANGAGFATGSILNFTTSAAPPSPPSVTTAPASSVSSSGATLNGNLGALGTSTSVTVGFLWGTDANLVGATNVTVGPQTSAGAFTSAVSGLSAGTTYYFEAWGNGTGFAHGTILSFTTQAAPPSEGTFLGLPATLGYAVLAVIIIVIVAIAVAVLMMRRRKQAPPETPPPSP